MDEKYNGFYPEEQNNETKGNNAENDVNFVNLNQDKQFNQEEDVLSKEFENSEDANAGTQFNTPYQGEQSGQEHQAPPSFTQEAGYGQPERSAENTQENQWQYPNANANVGYVTSSVPQQRNYYDSFPPNDHKKRSGGFRVFIAGVAGVLVGALLMTGVVGGLNALGMPLFGNNNNSNAVPPQQIDITNNTPQEVVAIASKAGRSVVGVSVTGSQTDPIFGTQQTEGSGSGVIVRKDGYILTNYHVIQSALDVTGKQSANSKIEVSLPNVETSYKATIVGQDQRTDLAVIKIDATNLAEIEWGDSAGLKVGELTVAIGNPGGLELAGSVTTGVVSGLNRKISSEYNAELTLIQTSAAINPGNSGGALVNSSGQLIGVNSSKIAGNGFEGIGFAIPSNEAKTIIDGLIKDGKVKGRPWFGVSINDQYNADYAKQYGYPEGLLVAEVMPFSGASDAGMKKNDIIVKFDGVETKTFAQLEEQKAKHKPGDAVKVEIYRPSEKKTITLNVKLSEEQG